MLAKFLPNDEGLLFKKAIIWQFFPIPRRKDGQVYRSTLFGFVYEFSKRNPKMPFLRNYKRYCVLYQFYIIRWWYYRSLCMSVYSSSYIYNLHDMIYIHWKFRFDHEIWFTNSWNKCWKSKKMLKMGFSNIFTKYRNALRNFDFSIYFPHFYLPNYQIFILACIFPF